MANVVTILHPDHVVLGGGASGLGHPFFEAVRKTVKERVGMFPTDDVAIIPSSLGDKAGMWGGLALARHGLE